MKSPWVGLEHFTAFFSAPDFWKLLINTLRISISSLIFGFPAPVILALLINELGNKTFKKTVQTVSYLPHFISLVVICGLIKTFVASDGLITRFIGMFNSEYTNLLNKPSMFVPIYVVSGIWQEMGWESIIYLAALSSVDGQLYEAAKIDGAGKFKMLIHITLPSILSTIIVMFILRVGKIMSLGFEKIFLLYNPLIYNTSDVISTYVYRIGIIGRQWSYTTAIGLFNSIINFILVISANKLSKKFNGYGLW
jgi:putative aldouronate transport system permease protein